MRRAIGLALALGFVGATLAQTPVPPRPAAAQTVAPAPAKPDAVKDIRVLVSAEEESTLSSQMAGKIAAIPIGIGAAFRKGQVLVRFDCAERRAQLDTAQAELLGARETHEAKLRLQGMGSAGELEVTLAAAAVEKTKSQVHLYETQMAFCIVAAPYAGRVARLKAKSFESVALGQPLIEIVNTASLKAQLHVPSNWLAWLKPGTKFEIAIEETGKRYPAHVRQVNGRIDAISQTIELDARFDGKHGELVPGMSGTALFKQ